MVKVKNKKNSLAADKLKKTVKKPNPFEIHINKQKFKVIGQKLKNDRGLPGISRTKAINKRKTTLLPEFNLKNKINSFLDRRIGEKNKNMTPEDRIIARFTAERVKLHKRKSIFNLGDDEVLTHKGQTLTDVEKFDDPRSDDEFSDDDDKRNQGRLDAGFVEDAHFGGGILSNTGKEGARSRKDLIEQLIAESKKRKAEKQQMREETIQLTEKLDTDWKDLLPLVNKTKSIPEESQKSQPDDFDKVMRELRFEARGQPTDRLRTEDEIAREDKERLEKLEQDRLARMKGFIHEKKTQLKHRSADDLDDDFLIESDFDDTAENDDNQGDSAEGDESQSEEDNENKSQDVDETKSDNDDDDNDNDDSEDDLSDLKADETSESDSEDENVDRAFKKNINLNNETTKFTDSEDESTIKSEDNSEKLNENQAIIFEADSTVKSKKLTKTNKKQLISEVNSQLESITSENRNKKRTISVSEETVELKKSKLEKAETRKENILEDLLARKKIMEDARNELPYTFSIPESYEDFEKLISTKSVTHQTIIVERMIKCTHPSLAETNKEKLNILFTYLLQFINDLSSDNNDPKKCFQFVDHLIPYLYDLAQLMPKDAHNAFIEVLKEKQSNYVNKKKKYPGLDTLVLFKIVSLLFPTSDFRHQIVTPVLVFMDQLITRCKVKTRRDIASGLFLVTLVLEYVTLSKRFLPSVINFLRGIFHSSIPKITVRAIPIIPPFKRFDSLLVLSEKYKIIQTEYKMLASDMTTAKTYDDDTSFKVRTMYTALKLCLEFYKLFEHLVTRSEIFEPILNLLQIIPTKNYPYEVQELHKQLVNEIVMGKESQKLNYLVVAAAKPKALRLYEPKIQQVFENRKHRNLPKEIQERDKLTYKLKKEKKGALREIRRDNAFLSKLKIKKQIESDKERKEKVKEILSGAQIQQGELNALDRKRKKK